MHKFGYHLSVWGIFDQLIMLLSKFTTITLSLSLPLFILTIIFGCQNNQKLEQESHQVKRLGEKDNIRWGTAIVEDLITEKDDINYLNIGTGNQLYSVVQAKNIAYLHGKYDDNSPEIYLANLVDISPCDEKSNNPYPGYHKFQSLSVLKDVSKLDFRTAYSIKFGVPASDCHTGFFIFRQGDFYGIIKPEKVKDNALEISWWVGDRGVVDFSQIPKITTITNSEINTTSPKNIDIYKQNYQKALNNGIDAANAAQSAKTFNEWSLVSNKWQKAINILKTAQYESNNEVVKKKIAEYKNYQKVAKQQEQRLLLAEFCQTLAPQTKSGQLELNNFQFYNNNSDVEKENIIGCIINRSNQTLSQLSTEHESIEQNGSVKKSSITPISLLNDGVKPNEIFVFKSNFLVSKRVNKITLFFNSNLGTFSISLNRGNKL